MIRNFVPLAVVVLAACAASPLPQGSAAECRFSPNPRSLQMDCLEGHAAADTASDALCPGSLNPKSHGSVFCARPRD